MKNADNFFNYINVKNNAKISFYTSQSNICYCSNILSDNIKVIINIISNLFISIQSIWLSQPGFPQVIIIDISDLKTYPKKGLNTFGIYCWHAYNTNPKVIELLISTNYNSSNKNNNFTSLGFFELELRDGIQLFNIDYNVLDDEKIKNKIKAIKLVIKSSFGGNKTYINQIMFYENTIQEIKSHETIQSTNTFQNEMNLPEDLSNSLISLEENSQQINNKNNSKINNNNVKKIKNIKNQNKKENNIINGNKIKKHNIIDFVSETHSKISDRNTIKREKQEGIKIEENNIIYNGNTNNNKSNEHEINNDNKDNDNEDENKLITSSEGFQNSYMDIKSTSKKNEEEYFNQNNENIRKNNNLNYNNKKVQKLEKILKQKILKNDIYNNNITPTQEEIFFNNYNNQNRTQEYDMNNFPNLTPILKNNNNYNYNSNRRNMNNQSNISERESNFENEESNEINNPIQKYFQIKANTPGRFTVNGYDYLMSKKRPTTPKINEIYLNQDQKKLRNKTLQNFGKNNLNKTEINNNKAYETLEYQLNDMEQHLQKMALNSDMILPNNNIKSRKNRDTNYLDNNNINNSMRNRKQNNNNSLISNNTTSYMNEEKNNMNNMNNLYNNSINNNNYFTNYKINNESNYANNTYYKEESREINERIDNLEKNIFEIRNELNNISSGIKLFLDKEYFLYNFKDSIKQICYDFFSEKIENNENNDNINQTGNENNENEEQDNSQFNNTELSESKNNNQNNINNKNEKTGIEDKINKKIDEKLDYLCNNLKNQIYEKYLQPSINEIENSMKQNIEDIKKKVDSMNYSNENNTNEINGEEMISSINNYEASLEKKNNQRKKYEEINRLGERLYDKLMEKEKKLKLLKQETTKLLNGKSMDNDISN